MERIEHEVVWATFETRKGFWYSTIGGESITGDLSVITRKIAANGWEIISVAPQRWTSRDHNVGLTMERVIGTSEVDQYAIFVKRTSSLPAPPPANLPPPPAAGP